MDDQTKVRACWEALAPLVQKAKRIRSQGWSGYERQMKDLEVLREGAGGLRTENGKSLLVEAIKLLAREAPPSHDDVMNLLKHLRNVLPEFTVDRLERQIDFQFRGTILEMIIQAEKELLRHAGAPPADLTLPEDQADTPVAEKEVNSLKDRLDKAKEQQRKIDADEQERSEREQAEAKPKAEAARKAEAEFQRKVKQHRRQELQDQMAAREAEREEARRKAEAQQIQGQIAVEQQTPEALLELARRRKKDGEKPAEIKEEIMPILRSQLIAKGIAAEDLDEAAEHEWENLRRGLYR